ncbi:isopentenyl-diphosphate delta-isomerase [Roseivivax marinus]|uniref:isopentenyl-diphosphate delta-isomerase n=1 Tax=Roseivivax marinus TaxID=1379903 RepID=UPI001F04C921|nr:isopentenyl-diphosphate delta-isomerase [Roseivivax marinus]UMA64325.1 isopentenyl-diphosphate delta-isomerase [Roseivivax marinus]
MSVTIPAWEDGTLRPVEKLEVHRRGLRHKAVSVFVLRDGAVLLQQRARSKYHTPGLWANTCCTHPHWDEDPATCAARRLSEELGIEGLTLAHRDVVEYRADVGGGLTEHEVVDLFTAEAPADLPLSPAPDEVEATAWMPLDALMRDVEARPDLYTPWLRIYLAEHSTRIFPAHLLA